MPPRYKTQQAICNYHDKMYDTKRTRYKHDANMEQIDHGIDVLQSLMEQLSNKHGASMQEGLKKWQMDRPCARCMGVRSHGSDPADIIREIAHRT